MGATEAAAKDKVGKVLVIYTGGTIGMVREDVNNPISPLKAADWEQLEAAVPTLKDLAVEVVVHQMEPIDSSDMFPGYWLGIAEVIQRNYDEYGGFVIMHGTDTMTYTATALSFLLENLDKPVVVTGSQLPIVEARNDAVQNLVAAVMFASPDAHDLPLVPEVCVCFNNTLLRGNRSRKVSSSGYAGFDTPNYAKLAEVGEHIKVNEKVIRSRPTEGFFVNPTLEPNVMLFDIFPGISTQILRSVFDIEGLKGVVFRTYGAGNAPTNEDFLREIKRAVSEKHLAIVNITQCNQGMVEMGLYDASAGMARIGVISGVDMTPEAALVKMMFLLGQGYDIDTVKDQMQKDLRGEQSVNVFNLMYEPGTAAPLYKAPAKQLPANFIRENIVRANVRLDEVTLPKGTTEGEIELAVYLNYPTADVKTPTDIPQCLAVLKGSYTGEPLNLILDCTSKFSRVVSPGRPLQVSVVSCNGAEVRWGGCLIAVFTSVDV